MTDDGWHLALTDPAPLCVKVLCIGANGGLFVGERSTDSPLRFTCPTTGAQGPRVDPCGTRYRIRPSGSGAMADGERACAAAG